MTRATTPLARFVIAVLAAVPAAAMAFPEFDWGTGPHRVVTAGQGDLVVHGKRRVVRHVDVAGIPMTVNYRFRDGELWQVRYFSRARHEDPGRYLDDHETFRRFLADEFGEPEEVVTEWTDDLLRDRPDYHGQAVQVGHLSLMAGWDTERARVLLTLDNEMFRPVQQAILTDPDVEL